ncbi:hypothetical protein DERP_009808, partial [Dermatophagoides pteronyssinus]
HQHYHHRRR